MSLNAAFQLLASWAVRLAGVPVVHFACQAGMSRCVLGTDREDPPALPPCPGCIAQIRPAFPRRCTGSSTVPTPLSRPPSPPGGPTALCPGGVLLARHAAGAAVPARAALDTAPPSSGRRRRNPRSLLPVHPLGLARDPGIRRALGARIRGLWLSSTACSTRRPPCAGGRRASPPRHLSRGWPAPHDCLLPPYLFGSASGPKCAAWTRVSCASWPVSNSWCRFSPMSFSTPASRTATSFSRICLPGSTRCWKPPTRTPKPSLSSAPTPTKPARVNPRAKTSPTGRRQRTLPNVLFVPSDEYFSSYELIQRAHFVMVYNSTIGLEASLMGAAVLCGGKARFTQLPTVFFPETPRIPPPQRGIPGAKRIEIPAEFHRNARRFLYYQLYKTSLPFELCSKKTASGPAMCA